MKKSMSDFFSIIGNTILFSFIILTMRNIVIFFTSPIYEANDNIIYYIIASGVVFIIVSIVISHLFNVKITRKDFTLKTESELSSNLLYMFVTILIVSTLSSFVYFIGTYNLPQSVLNIIQKNADLWPSIKSYNGALNKIVFTIAIMIGAFLNATGEELFIHYISYKQLSKNNIDKRLRFKFVIITSLTFGIYLGWHSFLYTSPVLGVTKFIMGFILSFGICLVFLKTKSFAYVILTQTIMFFTDSLGLHLVLIPYIKNIFPALADMPHAIGFYPVIVYLIVVLALLLYRYVKKRVHK